ncbi:MAG: threonylcarbamoyl-AMP synthase [Chloroflexi bacterium]|nr:threonylcarbamoyl-AMP synthase [Chloroflexota bacterium]
MPATCEPATPEAIARAAAGLAAGGLAIVPTDTVYGIAADLRRDDAVRALYAAKGKGEAAPLQVLFGPDLGEVELYATWTPAAASLVSALGPGGWTIILPAVPGWESPALAGGRTIGVRIPDAPVVHALVAALGAPLAASSANQHGSPSPRTCAEATAGVGAHCAIALDGGPCPAGIDSTVIDLSSAEVRILREGAIDRLTVARILDLPAIPVLRSVRP